MSSGDEDYANKSGTGDAGDDAKSSKKRRIQRACDNCRRKKIRCDGATTPGNKCSNCAAYNLECTYVEAAKKRGPPKGYVESLENRLQKMETLLQRLCPNEDFTQELGVHMDRETWYNEQRSGRRGYSSPAPFPPLKKSRPPSPHIGTPGLQNSAFSNPIADDIPISDDELAYFGPSEELKLLTVTSLDRRFHGKSSGLVLVQTAIDMKREYTGGDVSSPDPLLKRPEFWDHQPEGPRPTDTVTFEFPPPDLMEKLIFLYFLHYNVYLPLLHRPSFERQYRERLYETDSGFASILLLVCAIASRSSDDSRVLGSRDDSGNPPAQHSAGWKYFDQLDLGRKSLISPATLFDLQQFALAGIFLHGSAAPHASWVMVGIGLRVGQDVGAHRKRVSDESPPTVEGELWKRAFWVLVNLDRLGSAALGRPCAIHDEDFDLDLPLEVDDEYWEPPNPEDAFKQPPDRPSTISYFNALIRLDQMLSFALRTIYSINKTKILFGFVGQSWEQQTVAELDSKLNQWIDTVPEHLRWNPSNEPGIFFQQSAILYATYYHIQILVHRPFIPGPRKPSPLSFPSLAICTNAARSCSHVLEVQRRKCDTGPSPHLMFYAFTSGLVLLLNIWGMRKGTATVDSITPMQDVHMCMRFLKAVEQRWHLAGRLGDILRELASVGDFPLPHPSPEISNKRERGSDSPKSAPNSEYSVPSDIPTLPRQISRPRSYVPPRRPASQSQVHMVAPDFGQTLPMTTVDLGRVPLHPLYLQHQQAGASGSVSGAEDAMAGVQWFPPQPDMSGAGPGPSGNHPGSAFGSPAPAQSMLLFGTGAEPQQIYPSSAPPFGGDFPTQEGQNMFPNGNAMPGAGGDPNFNWGETLDMWSAAPSGFQWGEWDSFATNMVPGSGPDGRRSAAP